MLKLLQKFQQWVDEQRMVRKVSLLRQKGLWFSDLQRNTDSSLPSIKIKQGAFNHEGRRILDTTMAEFLMRMCNAADEIGYSFYLKKAKELNDQLGLDGFKRFLLDDRYYGPMFLNKEKGEGAFTSDSEKTAKKN